MNIVIAGHVDHGKSTVIGRLLADTDSLPEGKLEMVKRNCELNSRPFEYAFLLDALKDEQSQGITIDSARVFFSTAKRDYIIIDAPGHIEFLKNMVTGASRAEAALLVIDAAEGIQENSRRHGYMVSMLGIKQIVALVSKMDLVKYDKATFDAIVAEYKKFLSDVNLSGEFIPVSGMAGDNITAAGNRMSWYKGPTVLEALDIFIKDPPAIDKPFRMPVQDVYKFTKWKDNRRVVAGTVATGQINVGDEIVFYPSGKTSSVKSIEGFNCPEHTTASAGEAVAFTLSKQIYIKRGEMAVKANQDHPKVTGRFRANIFWMGKNSLEKNKKYMIKLGTTKETVELEQIIRIINGADLSSETTKRCVERHDVAECIFTSQQALTFDLTEENAATSRFVIVDNYEICGGGIIRQALEDKHLWLRDYVMRRNYKWETGIISREDRAERYNQKSALILITGEKDVGKKSVAKAVEAKLFAEGKIVYFLGIGNILYGVDADIKAPGINSNKPEHLRRLSEVANIMLDAGIILIITAVELTNDDLEIIKGTIDTDSIEVIWVGDSPTDVNYDVKASGVETIDEDIDSIKKMLQNKGIIFKP
ncbi:MAG: adenylyl-sulfate kinase [Planctomycetes bacterium]|nr:adenylyl-sulfate kinase [Planctomycetota bacterium]